MKKFFALVLALVMALSLVACGQKADTAGGDTTDSDAQTQTDTQADTQTDTQSVDLRAAYEAGIKKVQDELGDNAPMLMEETDKDYINNMYPGINDVELKQSVFFLSPTGTYCDVVMVEVANASDVDTVKQIFQTRIDTMAGDTEYVNEAELWKNNAQISVNGSYVVLEVMPDGCTVPDEFLAKF